MMLPVCNITSLVFQRQTLRAVPVSEVAYNFKDKASVFWVYGKERRVCAVMFCKVLM